MAKQTINPGTAPTGAGGDTFRSGSAKLQANDDELYTQLGANPQGVLPAALPINKGGTGAVTAAAARTALGLGTAAISNSIIQNGFQDSIDLSKDAVNILATGRKWQSENNQFPNNWGHLIFIGSHGLSDTSTGSRFGAIFIHDSKSQIFFKNGAGNDWAAKTWIEIYHNKNTTKDSNGFLKAASPVAQLFSNEIKLNDEATQQPITFEKLGIGDYLVKGSLGFAQEGWYIEQPKDANGNVLVAVVYKQLENNDISVKTYQKKFDLETASIVADLDKPTDIPDGRWIDLRLQELPQPEIEEPESVAPPEFQPTGLAQAVATVMESYHDPEQ